MQNLDQHMQRAVTLHQQGHLTQAEALYRQALQHHPTHHGILNLLGTLCAEQEHYAQGIDYLRQAIAHAPKPESYMFNLGEALCRHQQFAEGVVQFEKLLSTPQANKAHYALAKAYQHLQNYEKACYHYAFVLKHIMPAHGESYYQYGKCLEALNRQRSALNTYQQGLSHAPEHAPMHYALARLLFADKQFELAEQHYLKTLELQPEHTEAHLQLWRLYAASDQHHKTQAHGRAILTQRPQDGEAIKWANRLAFPVIPQHIAEKEAAVNGLQEALTKEAFTFKDLVPFVSYDLFPPYTMAYYGFDDRPVREAFARRIIETDVIQALPPAGQSRTRERVGFVVTSGHEGVFIKCMAGMVQQLQEEFEVVVVCVQSRGQRILTSALPQCNYLVLPRNLLQAAKALQAADFDLLYYWEIGTDSHNYFLPFFRTARKQASAWGWPVTSGIPYVDAYFSSQALEPAQGNLHYTEPLFQAERLLTYYTPPVIPPKVNRESLGIKARQHVYLCTQNLRKVQPEMDPLLAGILKEDPQGQIFFIADKLPGLQTRLQQRWAQNNLDLERLHILPRMPVALYLQWVKAADVILDTPCYTGGANTNYDAFQAGTPVVTLAGQLHRGRYTTAAYQQMGYTPCVAHSAEAYVQQAIKIAGDPEYRQEVSQEISQRHSALFKDTAAVKSCAQLMRELLTQPEQATCNSGF